MTQADAANYKRHCQERVKDASTRAFLQCLKAFWNWNITQGETKENIWLGLTKKLKHSEPKPPIDAILLAVSKDLAVKENNIAYFIQYYTGCRRNEHQGLRWCDVDFPLRRVNMLVIRTCLWRVRPPILRLLLGHHWKPAKP